MGKETSDNKINKVSRLNLNKILEEEEQIRQLGIELIDWLRSKKLTASQAKKVLLSTESTISYMMGMREL